MHPMNARAAGFTLVEAMVALAILGILLALGVPRLGGWLAATRAEGAGRFYADGFNSARALALAHNGASRLVFIENANGQYDWRVDICFPSPDSVCSATSSDWSSATAGAKGAPGESANFRSLLRSASTLPPSGVIAPTLDPEDDSATYFTPLGWVDASQAQRVTSIDLEPSDALADDVKPSRVVLTLAGMATVCRPGVGAGDSRRCPQ